MRNTTTVRHSHRSALVFDRAWYAVRSIISFWAEHAGISTYGQSEVFLAGINGDESCMRHRMSAAEKKLADVVYRLGQFAEMVAGAESSQGARIGMIAAGKALRQLGAGKAAEKIYLAMRGF